MTLKTTCVIILGMIITIHGEENMKTKLPPPELKGKVSVEEAIKNRRSIRSYKPQPLTLKELSQLLWATDGKTDASGKRAAPSAGATYPLEIYAVVGKVEGMEEGIYYYNINEHTLSLIKKGDFREKLARSALNQTFITNAPVTIVIGAIFERTTSRYGKRGERYVYMEAGHAGQNIHLQAEALGLGTVMIGAFEDEEVKKVLSIQENVLYLCPVGRK